MSELKELNTIEDLEEVWDKSTEGPVLLFKQSTTCPISAAAFSEYNTFLESKKDLDAFFVKVRETREVSNQVAEETGVQHNSPQILLIKDREVLWNESHNNITVDSIEEAVNNFQ